MITQRDVYRFDPLLTLLGRLDPGMPPILRLAWYVREDDDPKVLTGPCLHCGYPGPREMNIRLSEKQCGCGVGLIKRSDADHMKWVILRCVWGNLVHRGSDLMHRLLVRISFALFRERVFWEYRYGG